MDVIVIKISNDTYDAKYIILSIRVNKLLALFKIAQKMFKKYACRL